MARNNAFWTAELLPVSMLLALVTSTAFATAVKEPRRLFVSYHAPLSCPDRATFIQRLLRHVSAASLTDDAGAGRTVSVTLQVIGDQSVGRMEFMDETGRSVMRMVRANDCEEAASAMAFVTALAIEALAIEAPVSAKSEATEPPVAVATPHGNEEATPGGASDGQARSGTPNASDGQAQSGTPGVFEGKTPSRKPDASDGQSPSRIPRASQSKAPPHKPATGANAPIAAGTSHIAPAPEPVLRKPGLPYAHQVAFRAGIVHGLVGPGVATGAGVEWGIGPRLTLPLVRLAATWTEDRVTLSTNQRLDAARFRLIAGEVQLCVDRVLVAPTVLAVALCSGPEFGQYQADGMPDPARQAKAGHYGMFWASAVAALHLHAESSRVFFDFSPSIRLPFVRREFVTLIPTSAVHRIPGVGFGAAWSIGVSFR